MSATNTPKPIAIVGISAEIPGGSQSENLDHAAFHDFLLKKGEAYEDIPLSRFNIDAYKGKGLGQVKAEKGAFLKDISLFDYVEFGVSAKDARALAVSTRKLLEQSFLALLDAGIDYRSKNVGCYMAAVDFDMSNVGDVDEFEARGSFAGAPCMIANRISYHLDLLGPSVPVDTACSSSLTAMHFAVQAIRSGDCDSALVGGCQANHRLWDWIGYTSGSLLSPDGKCKPFDATANGFGRGEGAVVVVIKSLEDAIRDGDRIYATILGTGINQCGGAAPAGAPVAEAQRDAMMRAFTGTGRNPKQLDFLELHATGTAAGDPTEANWVGATCKRDDDILVGSVKGNIGHLEVTAFLASLSKVCSIFTTGIIPPNVNVVTPNPAIKWDEYKLRVPHEPTPLKSHQASGKSLISIGSSGIGGSNGSVILESAPKVEPKARAQTAQPVLLVAGGLSPRSATAVCEAAIQKVGETDKLDLPVLSALLGRRARQMTFRSFAVYAPNQKAAIKFASPSLVTRNRPPLVFVFSGQGPQNLAMGRQLFATNAVFRQSILDMDKVFQAATGESIITNKGLFDGPAEAGKALPAVWPISLILPSIAMVQVAMVDVLRSIGIVPDIVIGHSAGETAMMYSTGSASKEMIVELAIARGKALSIPEKLDGTMAAVSCTAEEAKLIVDAASDGIPEGKVEIACYNAPDAVTLAGLTSYIEKAVEIARERGFFATKLRTKVPIHSSIMETCKKEYMQGVADVFAKYPADRTAHVKAYSTLDGAEITKPYTPEYFWETTRHPVQFSQAMTKLLEATPNATFLELSPHPVLAAYMSTLGAQQGAVLCPMRRSKDTSPHHEQATFLDAMGRLVVRGHNNIDFSVLTGSDGTDASKLSFPAYPFVRKHVPYFPDSPHFVNRQLLAKNGPMNGPGLKINSLTHPDLAEHVIRGEPIMPAAGYLEMAFEFGASQLWNVGFHSMLSLSSNNPTPVHVDLDGLYWSVKSEGNVNQEPKMHASGYLSYEDPKENFQRLDIDAIRNRCQSVKLAGFYDSLEFFASYGPKYQRMQALYKGEDEFLVEIKGPADDLTAIAGYVMHPAILDSSIHIGVHKMCTGSASDDVYYLPSRVETVILHELLRKGGMPEKLFVHMQFRRWRPEDLTFDFYITNAEGNHLMTLRGFEVARHRSDFDSGITRRFDMVHKPVEGLSIPNPPPRADLKSSHFTVQYARGNEMDIQAKLSGLDQDSSAQVWITASAGADGAAARGFSRALRREIYAWDIRLALFPANWTSEMRISAVSYLAKSTTTELEVVIDKEGTITTPRFEESEAPEKTLLKHNPMWQVDETGKMSHSVLPSVPDDSVLVSVERVSVAEGGLRGFVGEVASGSRAGMKVMGVTDQPLSNYTVVHEGWTVPVDVSAKNQEILPAFALGAVAVELALGSAVVAQPSRARKSRVLVAGADSAISSSIVYILSCLGIQHQAIGALSPEHVDKFAASDVVISGYTDKRDVQLMQSVLPAHSTLYLWNDESSGARAMIRKQVWLPADAISSILRHLPSTASNVPSILKSTSPKEALGSLKVKSEEVPQSLFDSRKTYLLIGGIGSLGMHIALWMYQRGARSVVLTSRSGIKSSAFQQNTTSKRILRFLQTIPDLSIRLESCDASSVSATKALLTTVSQPVGGVMLLSGIVSDRSFFSQTPESFALPFESKQLAFQTLEKSLKIQDLDFLVTFSTVSTFGNPGQSNYAGANTMLDELTRPYANAFSLICPLILDSSVASTEAAASKLAHLEPWGMTSEELCKYIEDGILKLNNGPFWLYIPDYEWNLVHKHMGSSFLYDHLVTKTEETEDVAVSAEDRVLALGRIVREQLAVDEDDFSANVPLTSYGLDSLSAVRLSAALRPFVAVTQLQLLANLSLDDIIARIPAEETA